MPLINEVLSSVLPILNDVVSRVKSSGNATTQEISTTDITPPSSDDLQAIARPDLAVVLREVLKTIANAGKDFALTDEFLKFIDLSVQGHTDVKISRDSDNYVLEYFLANDQKPILRLPYSVSNGKVNFSKLEMANANGEVLSTTKSIFNILRADATAYAKFNEIFIRDIGNYKYLEEFTSLKDKQQEASADGFFVATKRAGGSKPYLVAELEKTNNGFKLKEFGKSDKPNAVTEPVSLGNIFKDEILQSILADQSLQLHPQVQATATLQETGTVKIDAELLAKAEAIMVKAGARLQNANAAARQTKSAGADGQSTQRNQPAKRLEDFLTLDDQGIINQAKLQIQSLVKALENALITHQAKLQIETSETTEKDFMNKEIKVQTNEIKISVPSLSGLSIVIPCSVKPLGPIILSINLADLVHLDKDTKKETRFSIDLSKSMGGEVRDKIEDSLKSSITNLLIARDKDQIGKFARALAKANLQVFEAKTVPGMKLSYINVDDEAFVFSLNTSGDSVTINSLVKVAGSITKASEKLLSSYLTSAESYEFGKPGGGPQAKAIGGVSLLTLSAHAKKAINDLPVIKNLLNNKTEDKNTEMANALKQFQNVLTSQKQLNLIGSPDEPIRYAVLQNPSGGSYIFSINATHKFIEKLVMVSFPVTNPSATLLQSYLAKSAEPGYTAITIDGEARKALKQNLQEIKFEEAKH